MLARGDRDRCDGQHIASRDCQTNCGTLLKSTVVTGNEPFQTASKAFVRVRGAVFTVVVPSGERRCIKVRFTAGATCRGNSGNEACFIRVVAGDEEMHPRAGANQGFGGRTFQPTGFAYQWVGRFGPGEHVVQIQVRTLNIPEFITVGVDDWTMDVEVLN